MKTTFPQNRPVPAARAGSRSSLAWRRLPVVLVALLIVLPAGCKKSSEMGLDPGESVDSTQFDENHFRLAVGNLQHLDESGADQLRQSIITRLTQWILHQSVPADWKPDPLVDALPEPLKSLPSMKTLDKLVFSRDDGYSLEEAVWARDVAKWAGQESPSDLAKAEALFDWVVCNIQLEREGLVDGVPRQPWEILLFGRGTAVERAWVFLLLAAQQRIDAVVLGLPPEKDSEGKGLESWAIGVLADGKVYVFDPALGLPIPGPEGPQSDKNGRLVIRPATLDQLQADPALLGRLALDSEHPYPVAPQRLKDVVALIAASPSSLSARMALVESKLAGKDKVLLTAHPSRLAERLKDVPGLKESRLWRHPFESLKIRAERLADVAAADEAAMLPMEVGKDSPLWKGRLLQLRDKLTGEHSATAFYQRARPSPRKLIRIREKALEYPTPEGVARAKHRYKAYEQAKIDASYWLGLVEVRLDNLDAAEDYWVFRSASGGEGPSWAAGIRYNRGRLMELRGEPKRAAEIYAQDTQPDSPTRYGNQLRARWLEEIRPKTAILGDPTAEKKEKE
ncbi:MAG: hypothetical protein JW818_21550 [Pirellulales bacterium]|nr:hypothetical protein [Pirellulales bacterium]